ncbi:MAG: nitroreductase family protein [Sporomusa sp.]
MNEIINLMKNRRTIRKYKNEQIATEELNAILDAGLHAPNAGGNQSAIIVACQNAKLNEELGRISRQVEALGKVRMGRVSSEQPSILDDENIKSAFYGAPTVVTLFAAKGSYTLSGDCFMAAENIVLAAESLGIGSCVVCRAGMTFDTERGIEIQREWGIGEEYKARIHVTLGYPDGKVPSYKPRKENRIKVVV